MIYHFELICPRCNKTSSTRTTWRIPPPHVNCGDCLMNDVEIVEMKVVAVHEHVPASLVRDLVSVFEQIDEYKKNLGK